MRFTAFRCFGIGIAMTTVEPKPEFQHLSEDAVLAALQDPDPANPIAVEVARLIAGYTANFQSLVEGLGYVPAAVLLLKPRWPIEAVALRLTMDCMRAELARELAEALIEEETPD